MARLARLVNLLAFVVVAANAEETTATNNRQERQSDYDPSPNIFGVGAVAGVTSRNGRISTSGGVHFYPADGVATGDGYYNPFTYTKAIDGKYASGSVQIHPGALGVSSSAQAGYIDPSFNWPMDPWARNQWQWPVQNQFYGQFSSPWINKMKLLAQSRDTRWMYPSFNPFFNLWR